MGVLACVFCMCVCMYVCVCAFVYVGGVCVSNTLTAAVTGLCGLWLFKTK